MPMPEAYRLATAGGRPLGSAQLAGPGITCVGPVLFLHDNLHGNYSHYSRRVQDILRESVPLFKARSIDEFELDISGCERLFERDYGGIIPFAQHLRQRVRDEVGLRLSVGIGPSRIIAKMASRHAKPSQLPDSPPQPGERGSGIFRVLPQEIDTFLAPHDVQAVPGIGPVTARNLRNMGIQRVGQLLEQPEGLLRRIYGLGLASLLEALRGGEEFEAQQAAFTQARQPKSIGHETTYERDEYDPEVFRRTLWQLTEDACRRLREAGLRARHVTVKLRYSDFDTHTHGGFLEEAADTESAFYPRVLELFEQAHSRRLRVRLLGVRLERLCPGGLQGGLFDSEEEIRAQRLFSAVDRIRARHGKEVLLMGPGVKRLSETRRAEALSTAGVPSAFLFESEPVAAGK
jgi:DNA polymerase-4